MLKRCAWCGEPESGDSRDRSPVSHGLCDACADDVLGRLGTPLQRFLETLDAPVLLVDAERGGRVLASGGGAAVRTGPAGGPEPLLGEVFECVNARRPGGCGRTIHCSGCAIRGAVDRTWRTGESTVRVPATLKVAPAGEPATVDLRISTERVGGRVLLRIDERSDGV